MVIGISFATYFHVQWWINNSSVYTLLAWEVLSTSEWAIPMLLPVEYSGPWSPGLGVALYEDSTGPQFPKEQKGHTDIEELNKMAQLSSK